MYRLLVLVLCFGWSLLAHAGLFGPDFEITKTSPGQGGEDAVLYLTNGGFTEDEKYFVFGRRDAGTSRYRFIRRDMESGEEFALGDAPSINALGGAVSGETLFFHSKAGASVVLYAMDVRSGKREAIWTMPENGKYPSWRIFTLTAALNGTRVVVPFADNVPMTSSAKDWHEAMLHSDGRVWVYVGALEDGKWTFKRVLEQTDPSQGYIRHVQLNPVTGNDLLYELNSSKKINRGFILDLNTGGVKPIRDDSGWGAGYMSHANYIGDGIVQYQMFQSGSTSIGIADAKKGTYKELSAGYHQHYGAFLAADGTIYVIGDGRSKQAATVVRYTIRNGKIVDTTNVADRGANTDQDEYHAHPRFSPSGKYLVYTSSNRIGDAQVVIVKAPLKEK